MRGFEGSTSMQAPLRLQWILWEPPCIIPGTPPGGGGAITPANPASLLPLYTWLTQLDVLLAHGA